MSEQALAECRSVTVVHGEGPARVTALDQVGVRIDAGEKVALWGPSGSGKTTLLHLLGGLITATSGELQVSTDRIAYVFQGSNLLPVFTAFENVAFTDRVATDRGAPEGAHGPEELLKMVGLGDKLDALPAELSGGEAQRVAIARALAQRPELLLCDEPTGHLDSDTGERVLDLIEALADEVGFTLVTATHDADVAGRFDRAIELADGRVVAAAVMA